MIRESLNFERGLDPKISMGVGKHHLDQKILEETDWAVEKKTLGIIYEILEIIRDYRGYPILVLKNKQHDSWPYRAISRVGVFGDYQETAAKALKDVKNIIDGQLNPMRESSDFERGKDPRRAMDIGKIHNAAWILNDLFFTQQYGESDVEGYRAEILSKDNEDTRKPTYFIKYMEGPMEGQISRAEKFEELFGQWWGMAKTKRKLHESVNFERGLDPMRSMDIGMFHFDVEFSGDIENMEDDEKRMAKKWNFKGIKIVYVEGNADEDSSELFFKLSDGDEIIFKQKSYMGPSRPDRADYAKISISSLNVNDFEVHDAWLDELSNGSIILATMRMYEDIKNQSLVKESLDFERGLKPYKALNIGREAQAESFKKFLEEYLRWNGARVVINDDGTFSYFCYPGESVRKYILEAIQDYGDGGKYKVKAIDLTSRGDPDGGEEHEYLISPKKSIKESIDFERGLEPKKAMGIGLTAWEKRIIEETDWHENLEAVLQVADIIKVIPDYMGSPIVIIKLQPENFAVGQEPYIGISKFDKTDLVDTEEIAEHDAKIDIENYYIRERDLKKMNLK